MNRLTARAMSRREFLAFSAMATGGLVLAACGGSSVSTNSNASLGPVGPMESALSIYNWDQYLSPDTLTQFKSKYPSLTVDTATYASNEDMLAKIEAGAKGYDIVVPTGYMVEIMIRKGLLLPLDYRQLTNFSHVDAIFRNPGYDPSSKHSVPKDWGTTETVGMALKYHGYSYNSDKDSELSKARDLLLKFKPNVGKVTSSYKADLTNANMWVSMGWNGDFE